MSWIQAHYHKLLLGLALITLMLVTIIIKSVIGYGLLVQNPQPADWKSWLSIITSDGNQQESKELPRQDDWVDYGTIISHGEEGEWDLYLFGAFSATALKKDGVYHLYYQGASGYDAVGDTVTGRAIGVATSPDGINFTQYQGNPVLTWSPTGNGEEGAVSSGATVVNDEVVMFYGANTEQDATKINADGRLAVSTDGFNFEDLGIVLGFRDKNVWGSGDELFPIIAFEENGNWFVYYLPNGVPQRHHLGVAWGESPDDLTQSAAARSGLRGIYSWGTGGYTRLSTGNYALFLNDFGASRTDVRIVAVAEPNKLSAPITSYQFDDYRQATVMLDEETRTWFMYYRNADETRYGVKLAPAGPPDLTPPTTPLNVQVAASSDQVKVTWDAASDIDTGIAQYRIYRDGELLSTVNGLSFETDENLELTDKISVSAVNYHGTEGPPSAPVSPAKTNIQSSSNNEKGCKEKNHQ